jgi:hypothetical protein
MLRFVAGAVGLVAVAAAAGAEPVGVVYDYVHRGGRGLPPRVVDGAGGHVVKVADVVIGTSGPRGFTLVADPAAMRRDGRPPIPVQVTIVPEGAGAPDASRFTTPAGARHRFSTTAPGSVLLQIYVRYVPSPGTDRLVPDRRSYTASMSVTARDN